jgi:hypothetical protein
MHARAQALLIMLGLSGCEGALLSAAGPGERFASHDDVEAVDEPPASLDCASPVPGPRPLRRLTRVQYNATVADLLRDTSEPANAFPPEGRSLNFNGIAEAQTVSGLLIEGAKAASEQVAEAAVGGDAAAFLGCDPAAAECVESFVRDFGLRAYRRPLEADEVQGLLALFAWGRDNQSVEDGVEMVLESILQSPKFLYRPELGGEEVSPGVRALTSFEMASRLSYFLTGSAPDSALLEAANEDRLKAKADIAAQADRLLATPRSREMFANFHREWLNLETIRHVARDPAVYAGFNERTPELLYAEVERFIDHVLFEGTGTLSELLTGRYTLANEELATYYGLSGPVGEAFERVELHEEHAGVLTQGGLLAHHAHALSTSPVNRGKFVRETFFCQTLPPPPPDIDITPPELDPNLTTRERFVQHAADPACAGCHVMMDPVGLAFEKFDASGRHRERENGMPIDTSGELVGTDVDGTFTGVAELVARLASSERVATCMTKQWLRYAMGRSETREDACTVAKLEDAFRASGHNVRALARAMVETDAFLYLAAEVTP